VHSIEYLLHTWLYRSLISNKTIQPNFMFTQACQIFLCVACPLLEIQNDQSAPEGVTTNIRKSQMPASIQSERRRQNFLMAFEAQTVAWLSSRMPRWVTSNRLTALGIAGAGLVFVALLLGRGERWWLLAGIVGLAINWFGDSLDGRLAYYRGKPRKWYGFALDVMADWISLCLMSAGFAFYFARYKFVPIIFMAAYGAGMLVATTRYKITGKYRIDSGKFGPTEMRLVIAAILLVEIALPQSVIFFGSLATLLMLASDVIELRQLLQTADRRDRVEKKRMMKINVPSDAFRRSTFTGCPTPKGVTTNYARIKTPALSALPQIDPLPFDKNKFRPEGRRRSILFRGGRPGSVHSPALQSGGR
jgi:phosphatidylglycerophosphate synthase